MTDVADKAREKIAALKAQIIDLEQFLSMYEILSEEKGAALSANFSFDFGQTKNGKGNVPSQKPVDNSVSKVRRMRNKMRPNHVAELMARIIREIGQPMTRGDLVDAFERRDVFIPFADKGRYIGTIAWRHKAMFKNIEGRGYWLPDLPLPAESPTLEKKEPE